MYVAPVSKGPFTARLLSSACGGFLAPYRPFLTDRECVLRVESGPSGTDQLEPHYGW